MSFEEVYEYAEKVLPTRADRGSRSERMKIEEALKSLALEEVKKVVDFAASDDYTRTRHKSSLSFSFSPKPLSIALEKIQRSAPPAAALAGAGAGVSSSEVKKVFEDLQAYFNILRDVLPLNSRSASGSPEPTLPTHREILQDFARWDSLRRKARVEHEVRRAGTEKAQALRRAEKLA